MIYVCDHEAAIKLQAVLRVNPRRIRPTLRKKTSDKAPVKHEQVVVKKERQDCKLRLSTEVWEVESDSDIELVAMAGPAMPSSSPTEPNPKAWFFCCIREQFT